MTIVNLTARFLLELIGIGAIAYAGSQAVDWLPGRIAIGLTAATGLVVLWALVVAPNADNPLAPAARVVIGSGLLLVAAVALGLAGQPAAAIAFGGTVIVNTALLLVLGDGMATDLPPLARTRG